MVTSLRVITIGKDSISIICHHLSYIDLLSLKRSCKDLSTTALPPFINVFISKLLECSVVPSLGAAQTFCDDLYETGAFVSGSFILDCLFNTNVHQDIDIYDQSNSQMSPQGDKFKNFGDEQLRFTQSLYKNGFKAICGNLGPDPILRKFIHRNYPGVTEEIFDERSFGKLGMEFSNTTCDLIQIIPVCLDKRGERSSVPRFINASFDLDICKSRFDGKNLIISHPDKLIHKYDFIKPNTRFVVSIYPPSPSYDGHKTEERMGKYRERGFNIQYHHKYHEIDEFIVATLKSGRYCLQPDIRDCFGNLIPVSDPLCWQDNIKYIDDGTIDLSKYD
ncbi:Hypothetical protein POVR1_LOCUS304 [uncultured virus]|nr:Hypothetical protein POVR1_LOCUS304 [uncultured virus]